ncbi:hypothetical protein Trydic_g20730 [Trypoxylus dichotomus]
MWQQVTYLVVYHILFTMFMWSYFQTTFTKNDNIPDKFKLSILAYEALIEADDEELQRLILEQNAKNLPNVNRSANGSVRYCEKCRIIKPDRAHHCSVCEACILKMDHHLLHNRTTLEALRAPVFRKGPDKQGFDLGKKNNFLEVFGPRISLWLVPVRTSLGNGYIFPCRKKFEDSELLLTTYNYTEDEERSIGCIRWKRTNRNKVTEMVY